MNPENEKFARRIIVDFDDTLAFHNGERFEESVPNVQLINKLTKLSEDGFIIDVFTARGSLSCTSREMADVKYRTSIEQWLTQHFPAFNSLSFDKPLAIAYIDDKAWLPNDFAEIEHGAITTGFSGNTVYRLGENIIKHDANAKETSKWMKSGQYKTPTVVSVVNNVIMMSYVSGITMTEALNNSTVGDAKKLITQVCETMASKQCAISSTRGDIFEYSTRIWGHIGFMSNDRDIHIYDFATRLVNDKLPGILSYLPETVYHGDMSTDNIIVTTPTDLGHIGEESLVYIDPIQVQGMFYSTYLDAAKLAATILMFTKHGNSGLLTAIYDNMRFSEQCCVNFNEFKILVGCELVRMYKYRKTMGEKNLVFTLLKTLWGF